MSLLPILSAGYRTIQLTQGYNTLVDMDDFYKFGSLRWCILKDNHTNYARRTGSRDLSGRRPTIRLHNAVNPPPPGFENHHKDHDGLNNTKGNLEHRTPSGNSLDNLKRRGILSSRYKGVSFHKVTGKWMTYISVKRKRITIGFFDSEVEAAQYYDLASKEYHGDLGSTNEKLFGIYW